MHSEFVGLDEGGDQNIIQGNETEVYILQSRVDESLEVLKGVQIADFRIYSGATGIWWYSLTGSKMEKTRLNAK